MLSTDEAKRGSLPLVSVVISAYNHERYVEAAIRSVIAQEYPAIELIVLNDGSKDRTAEVIRALDGECRARFVRYEFVDKQNEGLAQTMNRALAWSRGEFFTGVASDDLMKPCKVGVLAAALAAAPADVGLVCGDADCIDDDSNPVDLDRGREQPVPPGTGFPTFLSRYLHFRPDVDLQRNFFSYETLIRGNYIPSMGVMWRRRVLEEVQAWTPGMVIEDWDMWLKLARNYRCVYVPEIVATYRLHATQTIRTRVEAMRQGIDRVYQREFPYVVRRDRQLAREVARAWLDNSRRLVRLGGTGYRRRLWRLDIRLAALGVLPRWFYRADPDT